MGNRGSNRRYLARLMVVMAFAFQTLACGASGNQGITARSSPFEDGDNAIRNYITSNTHWHTPPSLDYDQPGQIGLDIGDSHDFIDNFQKQFPPGTQVTPGGAVLVGPVVKADLTAVSGDADITQDDAPRLTGSNVELEWMWPIRPESVPLDGSFRLTARVITPVKGSDAPLITTLSSPGIPINGLWKYYAHRFFDSFGTWKDIGATVVAICGAIGGFMTRHKWLPRLRSVLGLKATSQATGDAEKTQDSG